MEKIKVYLNKNFNMRLLNLLPYIFGSALFIITPIVFLVMKASMNVPNLNRIDLIKDNDMWSSILRSVMMGLIASILMLFIAFPFTWTIARSKSQTFKIASLSLMISPVFIFSIVKIFSLKILLMNIFDQNYLPPKKWIVVLGMVYLYIPYMIIPLYSIMRTFPQSLIDASNDLGNNSIKTMLKVVLPYTSKAIFSGLAITFMMSSTTLIMSKILIDNGTSIESVRMIGNVIEMAAWRDTSDIAIAKTSTMAIFTIVVVLGIYGFIYVLPILYKKIKGCDYV